MPLSEREKAQARARYALNKQNPDWWKARRARDKKYRDSNREKFNERSRKWAEAHPLVWKERHYKYKYGVTYAQFLEMVDSCRGVCPVCQRSFDKTKHRPCLDHSHKDSIVRGVLCHSCNAAEGLLADSTTALRLYHFMVKNEGIRQGQN